MTDKTITYVTKKGTVRTRRPRGPSDVNQINDLARKVMKKMGELLDNPLEGNKKELFSGCYSMVSALNTLAKLLITLESKKKTKRGKKQGAALTVSEADIQLLEQFLAKQKPAKSE